MSAQPLERDGHTLRGSEVGHRGPRCWGHLDLTPAVRGLNPVWPSRELGAAPAPAALAGVAEAEPSLIVSCDSGWVLFWVWSC